VRDLACGVSRPAIAAKSGISVGAVTYCVKSLPKPVPPELVGLKPLGVARLLADIARI